MLTINRGDQEKTIQTLRPRMLPIWNLADVFRNVSQLAINLNLPHKQLKLPPQKKIKYQNTLPNSTVKLGNGRS